jgi:B12-binding domain/radical SAM domain protein
MRLFGTDLVLLHPPSVYDFRKILSEYGPISDVIFSSPAYEMYPVGLTSIASHLEEHGHNVRIVNVAHRMVSDPDYDAEAAIARLDPAVFGIGLHWLPHAHGALALARIVKRHHPGTPVVFGGLSASYFHEELIRSPDVDFVVRGDSTEEPVRRLVSTLQLGGDLERIPNLTWKKGGEVVVNPLTWTPSTLDGPAIPDVFYAIRSVFKYRSLADVVPFTGWLEYPITGLLVSRGCSMACAVCGGSRPAYRMICNRSGPAFRSPEALVRDVHRITRFSRGPIFLIHDLRQAGRAWTEETLGLLARERPRNEIVLELFAPVGDDYLERVGAALPRWSLEITVESHVERIRALNRRFDCTNEAIEHTIRQALENGAGRVDLFFMVGIPGQTYDDAVGCVDFCRSLLARLGGDRRLSFFVAPLAPFLDPGSEAYEQPERFGYRVRFRTLEEHRAALTAPNWKEMLSYETAWMTRDEIVAATYEALRGMTRLKAERGQISLDVSIETLAAIDASEKAVAGTGEAPKGRSSSVGAARFQKNDLVWRIPGRHRFAPLSSLAGIAVELAVREARLLITRRLPLYLFRRV